MRHPEARAKRTSKGNGLNFAKSKRQRRGYILQDDVKGDREPFLPWGFS
jgi:hypothetical protein